MLTPDELTAHGLDPQAVTDLAAALTAFTRTAGDTGTAALHVLAGVLLGLRETANDPALAPAVRSAAALLDRYFAAAALTALDDLPRQDHP